MNRKHPTNGAVVGGINACRGGARGKWKRSEDEEKQIILRLTKGKWSVGIEIPTERKQGYMERFESGKGQKRKWIILDTIKIQKKSDKSRKNYCRNKKKLVGWMDEKRGGGRRRGQVRGDGQENEGMREEEEDIVNMRIRSVPRNTHEGRTKSKEMTSADDRTRTEGGAARGWDVDTVDREEGKTLRWERWELRESRSKERYSESEACSRYVSKLPGAAAAANMELAWDVQRKRKGKVRLRRKEGLVDGERTKGRRDEGNEEMEGGGETRTEVRLVEEMDSELGIGGGGRQSDEQRDAMGWDGGNGDRRSWREMTRSSFERTKERTHDVTNTGCEAMGTRCIGTKERGGVRRRMKDERQQADATMVARFRRQKVSETKVHGDEGERRNQKKDEG
ncbi:hypothetical protein DFH08DRAFT_825320 [Mycena albidolilacea]|uniref:Uncharacterized protein n=1 Tax=Mycena albidolilacea TaxID=1033008 RepID=A0AAD7EA51_9AGAR|nr:hypothetical protein DFH08DRAFT_825320 [Mycena albidolilacea]